jgi:hypothetical protein
MTRRELFGWGMMARTQRPDDEDEEDKQELRLSCGGARVYQ